MEVNATLVRELREKTGAGILDCKKALQDTHGDLARAIETLRVKGLASAQKKAGRETKEGLIGSYIHAGGKLGVLVEVNCETDFVARTDEFQELVKDLSLQVAGASPSALYVRRGEVPAEAADRERRIVEQQAKESGKPPAVIEKIVQGRMEKFYGEICLMEQPFIKDPSLRIQDLISQKIAKIGENISVRRFVRFRLGEE
jgi:elongation factor Ts